MVEHSTSSGVSGYRSLAQNLLKRLQKIRSIGASFALVLLFVLVNLVFDEPLAESQQQAAQPLTLNQHGPVQTLAVSLPQLPSKTHLEQARAFSRKLVAGFGLRPDVALEFSDWILEAADRQKLQPELVASLVFAESSFRKAVQSHVGAVGPAQVRPHYWGEFCGRADLYDPEQNIYCGTQVLGYLLERCEGDRACALSAYNVGINSKRHAAGSRYVAKIDRNMAQLQSVNL